MLRIVFLRRLLTVSAVVALTACSLGSTAVVRPKSDPLPAKATVDPLPNPDATLHPPQSSTLIQKQPTSPVQPASSKRNEPLPEIPLQPRLAERGSSLVQRADKSYETATLTEDVVWRGVVQVSGWVTVPQQVTLTVEAGTVVRFRSEGESGQGDAGLLVLGRLVVAGNSDKPVLFTGSYAQPVAGDWQGIVLLASDKKNLLEQSRVEGARVGLDSLHSQLTIRDVVATACGTGFSFRDSIVTVAGGGVTGCGLGMHSADSELELRDISVSSNTQGVGIAGGSLYLSGATLYGNKGVAMAVENGKLKITGSSFTVNGTGLRITGSEGMVSFNRLLNNRDSGMHLINSRLKINGNEISQNSAAGLKIVEGGNVLWGNILAANNGHDLEYSGAADLAAMGNWWGGIAPDRLSSRIQSGDSSGRVRYLPLLFQRPQSGI